MRPRRRILLVNANEQELGVLRFMLDNNGYKVYKALNGSIALKIFAEAHVDLVLADYALGKMTGAELAQRMKAMGADIPVILLGDPAKMAQEARSALSLDKKIVPAELLERIKVMCARKRGPKKKPPKAERPAVAAEIEASA